MSYEVNDGSIDVLIANRSSETIEMESSWLYVLTDEGIPVYSDLEVNNGELAPGGETVISFQDRFAGSATNIRVLLDYVVVE